MITLSPITYSLAYGDGFDTDPADLPAKRAEHAGEKPISQKPVNGRQKPAGLLQKPFGYFNPGLGAMIDLSGNDYNLATPHPTYTAVKSGYSQDAISTDKPDFSGSYASWSVFLDLGQFRLGHNFSSSDTATLLRESYQTDRWHGTDTIKELTVDVAKQNYAWLSLALLSYGEKEKPFFFTLWLDYGLDRYRFALKESDSLRDFSVYPAVTQPTSETELASGTGWGHNVSLDMTLASSTGRGGSLEFAWFFSLRAGYNWGELRDGTACWQSQFSGWTAGLSLGGQFNLSARQKKTEKCYDDPSATSGKFCDLVDAE
jgi:hypothetical protein